MNYWISYSFETKNGLIGFGCGSWRVDVEGPLTRSVMIELTRCIRSDLADRASADPAILAIFPLDE